MWTSIDVQGNYYEPELFPQEEDEGPFGAKGPTGVKPGVLNRNVLELYGYTGNTDSDKAYYGDIRKPYDQRKTFGKPLCEKRVGQLFSCLLSSFRGLWDTDEQPQTTGSEIRRSRGKKLGQPQREVNRVNIVRQERGKKSA